MNASELKQKGLDELDAELAELLKEQFNLRMQQGTGQLTQPHRAKAVRRDIARVKTVINEKKSGKTE